MEGIFIWFWLDLCFCCIADEWQSALSLSGRTFSAVYMSVRPLTHCVCGRGVANRDMLLHGGFSSVFTGLFKKGMNTNPALGLV